MLTKPTDLEILTPDQAAERLQVPTKTVILLCARGEIPGARKVGRRWRIPAWGIARMFEGPVAHSEAKPLSRTETLALLKN